MVSPTLERNERVGDDQDRLGAALAALARRSPPRTKAKPSAQRPPIKHDERQTVPYSPWTRRSRPLYNF